MKTKALLFLAGSFLHCVIKFPDNGYVCLALAMTCSLQIVGFNLDKYDALLSWCFFSHPNMSNMCLISNSKSVISRCQGKQNTALVFHTHIRVSDLNTKEITYFSHPGWIFAVEKKLKMVRFFCQSHRLFHWKYFSKH